MLEYFLSNWSVVEAHNHKWPSSASLTSQTKTPSIFKVVHGSLLVSNDRMCSDLIERLDSRRLLP